MDVYSIVLCTRRFESHPRREGPSKACVVFLKRAYEAILGTTSPVSSTFPFSMSGCISIWRWTANPLCSASMGSNPILVVKGPQGLVLSFSNEHTMPFYGLHPQCPLRSLSDGVADCDAGSL